MGPDPTVPGPDPTVGINVGTADALELCYRVEGDPSHEPVLMIMGLTSQLIHWPQAIVDTIVDAGYQVIRFDNRDSGRTTWVTTPPQNYALRALSQDAQQLLDHLGITQAHIVGASMGGMIAQRFALDTATTKRVDGTPLGDDETASYVKSLCSIMSTPHATVGMAATEIIDRLQQALPDDPALAIEEIAARYALIGSTTYADEESDARLTMARTAYERATKADGTQLHPAAAGGRQVGAIMRAPSRAADLKELSVETLVIHGDEDSMITIAGGRATFNALPQATRTWLAHPDDHDGVRGMGHGFPVALQSVIANAILAHISTEAPVTA